jgi:3-methyladenine DNA glycosylase AlkD
MKEILDIIRQELKHKGNKSVRFASERFFKEEVKHYGLKNGDVHLIAKKYFPEIKSLGKEKIFRLCEELFKSGYQEECIIAIDWCLKLKKEYLIADIKLFEYWIETYVTNWAVCDGFGNHCVGEFLLKYPEKLPVLKKWAKSKNRWMRRSAAVSLIVPARKGLYLNESIEIAEILLTDEDDLVQKGYGWLLKGQSEVHLKIVFDFVMKHKNKMPRTALRYAIEKMPTEQKKKAMTK